MIAGILTYWVEKALALNWADMGHMPIELSLTFAGFKCHKKMSSYTMEQENEITG